MDSRTIVDETTILRAWGERGAGVSVRELAQRIATMLDPFTDVSDGTRNYIMRALTCTYLSGYQAGVLAESQSNTRREKEIREDGR